jgi:DNA-binding Lrp family transcriptional regulator
MKAYVLIKISTGDIPVALKLLRRLQCAREVTMTFGPFDAIAVLEAPSIEAISGCVAHEIQSIPGVVETCTCLAIDGIDQQTKAPITEDVANQVVQGKGP